MPAAYTKDARDAAFFSRVKFPDDLNDCWVWTGANNGTSGHGRFQGERGVRWQAHRWSWTWHYGPIPEGLVVRHRCDNPPCVNPLHLLLGTQAENARDAVTRGRARRFTKVTDEQVRDIRRRHANGERAEDIAQAYALSVRHTYSIIARTDRKKVA